MIHDIQQEADGFRMARALVKVELEVAKTADYPILCMTAYFADGHKLESSVRCDGAKTDELFSKLWQGLRYTAAEAGYFSWSTTKLAVKSTESQVVIEEIK